MEQYIMLQIVYFNMSRLMDLGYCRLEDLDLGLADRLVLEDLVVRLVQVEVVVQPEVVVVQVHLVVVALQVHLEQVV
jgi:hypothetical protein